MILEAFNVCLYIGVQIFIVFGYTGQPEVVKEALADQKKYFTSIDVEVSIAPTLLSLSVIRQSVFSEEMYSCPPKSWTLDIVQQSLGRKGSCCWARDG